MNVAFVCKLCVKVSTCRYKIWLVNLKVFNISGSFWFTTSAKNLRHTRSVFGLKSAETTAWVPRSCQSEF